MYAKILKDNQVYYSFVFAHKKNKVIILNKNYTELIVENVFNQYLNQIAFVDYDYRDFKIIEDDFKSFWDDHNIFKIIKQKKYSKAMLNEAIEKLTNFAPKEFYEVTSNQSLDGFLLNTGDFHDAFILRMIQKNDELELLINSTRGSYFRLKCNGIIENNLEESIEIFSCEVTKETDYICFLFAISNGSKNQMILKVKKISYDILFTIRFDNFDNFNYQLDNDILVISNTKKQLKINLCDLNNQILDFNDQNVIGFYNDDTDLKALDIITKDLVLEFNYFFYPNKKDQNNFIKQIKCLKQDLNLKGYNFINFYESEDEAYYKENYGELLFSETYGIFYEFLYNLKIYLFIIIPYNLFWLILKLCSPKMKWAAFYIFGLGITFFITLIIILSALYYIIKFKPNSSGRLELTKKRFFIVVTNKILDVSYEEITKVSLKKRIIIYTNNKKIVLPKTKNVKQILNILIDKGIKIE